MAALYLKKHCKSPGAILIALLLLLVPAWALANTYVPESERVAETARFLCAGTGPLFFWYPLFTLFLIFQQRFFTKPLVLTRYASFSSLWKTRLCVLVVDTALFSVVMQAGYFLLRVRFLGAMPANGTEWAMELRCIAAQFVTLLVYALLCAVLSALSQNDILGYLLSYGVVLLELAAQSVPGGTPVLFLKGFLVHGSWWAVCKTALLCLAVGAGLLLLLWCLASDRDYLEKEDRDHVGAYAD